MERRNELTEDHEVDNLLFRLIIKANMIIHNKVPLIYTTLGSELSLLKKDGLRLVESVMTKTMRHASIEMMFNC